MLAIFIFLRFEGRYWFQLGTSTRLDVDDFSSGQLFHRRQEFDLPSQKIRPFEQFRVSQIRHVRFFLHGDVLLGGTVEAYTIEDRICGLELHSLITEFVCCYPNQYIDGGIRKTQKFLSDLSLT